MRAANLVGRAREMAALRELLGERPSAPAAVLAGVAGIGKTSLLDAAAELARARGFRVLAARPAESELQISFAGLSDMLDEAGDEELAGLPAPQHRALQVALARAEPAGLPPEPLAIAAGFVNALRQLARREPLLIAVDDAQWLDAGSAGVLVFTARRAAGVRVRFLLARRSGAESELERAFTPQLITRIPVSGLDVADTRKLLATRSVSLPSRQLRQVVEISQGNPLVILELARVLLQGGHLDNVAALASESLAGDLFRERLAQLPTASRRALLAVAISPQITETELAAVCGADALEGAVAEGVLLPDHGRLRPSHPLLAAAAVQQSTSAQRHAVHQELAGALVDEIRAAHHLAMATAGHDAVRASRLAAAAELAMRRAALHDAVELAGHALALTPPGDAQLPERVLALGEYLLRDYQVDGISELMARWLQELPGGAPRARAHLLLAEATLDLAEHAQHLEQALEHSEGEPSLRATALALKAALYAVILTERLDEAAQFAEEGLRLPALDARGRQRLLVARAWVRVLSGRPVLEPLGEGAPVPDGLSLYEGSIERPAAVRLAFRGEQARARAAITSLLAIADERGEALTRTICQIQAWEFALRAGDIQDAQQRLADWDAGREADLVAARLRGEALLAAVIGDPQAAVAAAEAALAVAGLRRWNRLESLRALGIAALLDNDPATAAQRLGEVWEHTRCEHIDDPGAFPVAGDLVEALVELDRSAEARAVLARLAELARAQDHPWGLATAARSEAIVRLAAGHDGPAVTMLEQSARAYGALGLRFDEARSLLVLGRLQRRHRRWGAARDALDRAAVEFDELGCDGWARRTRSELARVGARRPQAEGGLTGAEARVVKLAAQGLSNKEIARELVVTVHTVEVHLSRAYAKLGVRSRSQLAAALAALGPER